MFVRTLRGPVSDEDEARRMLERWRDEVAPYAQGWLGTTAGTTDDGVAISVTRFVDEEAVRRLEARPERAQWWSEASKVFTEPPVLTDCPTVFVGRGGGWSDRAGFVQVMRGRTSDPARMLELGRRWAETQPRFADFRPDLLATLGAVHGDDPSAFTTVGWFTTEAEAREGERSEPPEELVRLSQEQQGLLVEMRYDDLRRPVILAPRG